MFSHEEEERNRWARGTGRSERGGIEIPPLRSGSELFHWGGSISIVSDR